MSTPISQLLNNNNNGGGYQPPMGSSATMGLPPAYSGNIQPPPMQMPMPMPGSANIGDPAGINQQFIDEVMSAYDPNNMRVPDHRSDINTQSMQYVMDGSQVPPERGGPSPPPPVGVRDDYLREQQQPVLNQGGMLDSINVSNGMRIIDLLKYLRVPIIVFVLAFLISEQHFNRFVFGLFPSLLMESGQIKLSGVFLKSFIAMVLAFIINIFI